MTSAVLALTKLSRKLKVVVVIIDAEDMDVEGRMRRITKDFIIDLLKNIL